MNKRFLACGAVCLLLAAAAPGLAQDEEKDPHRPGPWNYGAVMGLNLAQSTFSDNWAGGDQGTITWAVKSDLDATRQLTRKFNLANDLQLAYGQTSKQVTDSAGKKKWSEPDKTTDLVQFESLGRFTLDSFVDPYVGFRLDSQFLDQSDPFDRTLFFNPVRLKETAGVARVFHESENRKLISRVGAGFRQNVARSFTDATGMTDGTESFTTNDGGLEFQTNATAPILGDRVQYKGQLLVFLPLFYSQSEELETYDMLATASDPGHEAVADFWKTADVNFQNTFDAKITEWLSVNLYAQLIYDKFDAATKVDPTNPDLSAVAAKVDSGIRKSGQFKQTLALAISYRFL